MKAGGKILLLVLALAVAAGICFALIRPPAQLVLTGIVTTDTVLVSPQIQGRLRNVLVRAGDAVTNGQLLAQIDPALWQADTNFYVNSVQQSAAEFVRARADLENARLNFERIQGLYSNHVESAQAFDAARDSYDSAQAQVDSVNRQIDAASAQEQKAAIYLKYTDIIAPLNGIVDTRVALQGEVVNVAQPIVTLINPDDLWVRVDVEETYIDRIRLGDRLSVRLPSGAQRLGTVFYRGVDADFATQRDVSRTKRDIKTFEIRLRCENSDRALAVGMTAYVTLPLPDNLASPQP